MKIQLWSSIVLVIIDRIMLTPILATRSENAAGSVGSIVQAKGQKQQR